MENAPRRVLDPSIDLKKHLKWFAKELKAQPRPKAVIRDLFNDAENRDDSEEPSGVRLMFLHDGEES